MPETALNRSLFQLLPKQKQIEFIDNLTEQEATELEYYWPFWARDGQIAPDGDWHIWLVNAGRGFGKTRVGAEWVIEQAQKLGNGGRIALVGETVTYTGDI